MDAPPDNGRIASLVFTSLAHGVNDGTGIVVSIIAASLIRPVERLSPLDITAMLVAYSGTSVLLSLVVGRWADRSGRPGALLALGLGLLGAGFAAFYVALTYTDGPRLLAAVIIAGSVTGFGTSFYHPLGGSILQAKFRGPLKGRALGINGSLGSLGRALYPSLYFALLVVVAGYGPIAVMAAIAVASAAAVRVALGEPMERRPKATPPRSVRSVATTAVLTITAIAFIRSIATQGIVSWIPTYFATARVGAFNPEVGLLLTVMYVPAIFGQPVFGWLVDRYDPRRIIGLATAGSALAVLAYLATGGIVAVLFLAVFGLCTFSGFPLFLGLVADYVPEQESSLGNALVWGIGMTGGGALGPLVVGAVIVTDYSNLGLAFSILAGLTFVAALGTLAIPNVSRDTGTAHE